MHSFIHTLTQRWTERMIEGKTQKILLQQVVKDT